MLVVPFFSYLVGYQLASNGIGYQVIPAAWYGYMSFPPAIYNSSNLSVVARAISSIQYLPATLAFTAIIIVVVGGILAIIFGYTYSIFAPSKHGPFDVPAPRVKTKKYRR